MCAVIGALIKNPTQKDFNNIRKVFHESKIRGMHATGMSVLLNDTIVTFKEPVSADNFRHLDDLEEMVNGDGNLYLVGHCRYSTSDLSYNQPIANDKTSVVHNGVISQHDPDDWEVLHGYKCDGKNDTELLLRSLDDYSPLDHWRTASLSVCELNKEKTIRTYRNGKRPLYLTSLLNGILITSTKDIPQRAGLNLPTMEVPMNTYFTFDSDLAMIIEKVEVEDAKDYQHYDIS
jgi:glutamine phosphoribosylpyrophosphate amidotransferase